MKYISAFLLLSVMSFTGIAFGAAKDRMIVCSFIEQTKKQDDWRYILRIQEPWDSKGNVKIETTVDQFDANGDLVSVPFSAQFKYVGDDEFSAKAEMFNPYTDKIEKKVTNGTFFGGIGYWSTDFVGKAPGIKFERIVLFCQQMGVGSM